MQTSSATISENVVTFIAREEDNNLKGKGYSGIGYIKSEGTEKCSACPFMSLLLTNGSKIAIKYEIYIWSGSSGRCSEL